MMRGVVSCIEKRYNIHLPRRKYMKYVHRYVAIAFSIITITTCKVYAIGNSDNVENSADLLNSVSTAYEFETGAPKIKLNVTRFYLQFYNGDDQRKIFGLMKDRLLIYSKSETERKEAAIANYKKIIERTDREKYELYLLLKKAEKESPQDKDAIENLKREIKIKDDENKKAKDDLLTCFKTSDEYISTLNKDYNSSQIPFIPLDLYSEIRASNANSSENVVDIFNADSQNPVGGLGTLQVYYKIHPTWWSPHSNDTRYWTIKPSISSSWIRVADESIKMNYDIGIIRLNIDVYCIFPVFTEDMVTDAGTIKISTGISDLFYMGSSKVKKLYSTINKSGPKQGTFSWRSGIDVNLTKYVSLSFEYRIPITSNTLEKSISLSISLAR
jgi:hypothetical protein